MRSRLASRRGTANLIATAYALIVLFAFTYISAEIFRIIIAQATLNLAADRAGQWTRTGRAGEWEHGTILLRREDSVDKLVRDLTKYYFLSNVAVTFTDKDGGTSAGKPNEIVMIKVTGKVKLLPVGAALKSYIGDHSQTLTLTGSTVVKNENF